MLANYRSQGWIHLGPQTAVGALAGSVYSWGYWGAKSARWWESAVSVYAGVLHAHRHRGWSWLPLWGSWSLGREEEKWGETLTAGIYRCRSL